MKNPLFHLLRGLLLCCLTLAGAQQARASHAQAGQLTYTYVSTAANGDQTYRVQMLFFRDCSGIVPMSSFPLNAVNSCGGTARTATLTAVGQPVIGTPYCTSIQPQVPCSLTTGVTSIYPNYVTYTYEGNIVLPPAAEWILSVEESSRPNLANLSSQGVLRLECRLNSLITPVGGGTPIVVTNSSPVFSNVNLPVPYVYDRQEATVSFSAVDPDRTNGRADSLVYSLERPLNGCNTYETYAPYPVSAGCAGGGVDPLCTTRLYRCNGIPSGNYLPTLPIAVRNDSVVGPCTPGLRTTYVDITPHFSFNSTTGTFSFVPAAFNPGGTSVNGLNKYALVGQVVEYRKINGRYYRVGMARRDFLVIVVQNLGNVLPSPPVAVTGQVQSNLTYNINRDTLDVNVTAGNYSRLALTFNDPNNAPGPNQANPLQNLSVFYPADVNSNLLQGGDIGLFTLTGNNTPTPTVVFRFQPTLAAVGQTIVVPLRIEDSGCPVKGVQNRTIRIRIRRLVAGPGIAVAGGSTGPVAATTACSGSTVQLASRISRPDSVLNQATGQVVLQQYAYRWGSTNPNAATNGLPAITTTSTLLVNPSVTTRYTLSVSPLYGFAPGTVVDTSSILVRVVPAAAAPTITRQGSVLTSSYATGNQWYLNGQPIAGATGQTYTAPTSGTYTVVASSTALGVTCITGFSLPLAIILGQRPALAGTSLSVAPNPTADGHVRVELTGYAQAATLSVFDLLGRQVQQVTISAPNPAGTVRELDLSAQPAGVYLLQVQTPGGLDVRRIVRQ